MMQNSGVANFQQLLPFTVVNITIICHKHWYGIIRTTLYINNRWDINGIIAIEKIIARELISAVFYKENVIHI